MTAELAPTGPVADVLPFDFPDARGGYVVGLEQIARDHVAALVEAERLTVGDRLLVGLVLDLARTVGIGANNGRAAGVAMASKQLLDAMDRLPALVPEVASTEWDEVVAALSGHCPRPCCAG